LDSQLLQMFGSKLFLVAQARLQLEIPDAKSLVLVASLLAVATTFCANNRSAEAGVIPAFSAPIDLGDASELLIKIKKKKHTDDDNNTTPNGEHACPAGYVVLDKPNKYGAFCEPKEGLPEPPKEKVVCKFPGQVGDDCYCPPGTEFGGFKGCIQKVFATYCGVETPGPGGDGPLILFKGICKDKGGEVMCIDCQDGGWGCCCGVWTASNPPHYPSNSCKK